MSRRILRTACVVLVAAAFTACSNPLAPAGKAPTMRDNVINPNGNVINPNGNVINPNGNVINPNGNVINPNGNVINPNANVINPNG
jgi:cysteine protease ATG4